MFDKVVRISEKQILRFLLIVILAFVCFQIVNLIREFAYVVIHYDFDSHSGETFPFANIIMIFFDILIALELLATLKPSASTITEKTKLILLVGLIAVSRKLITLDVSSADYTTEIGIAILLISLTTGYYLLSKINKSGKAI